MPERPPPIRVLIAGQEILVPDREALQRLVDAGQIGASAEVRVVGTERWMPLGQFLGARGGRRDPWDAWESAETVDPEAIWREFAPQKPATEAPIPGRVVPISGEHREEVEDLPSSAVFPMEMDEDRTDPQVGPPSHGPRSDPGRRPPAGKVIAFPVRPLPERPSVEGNVALAAEDEEPVLLRPPPRPVQTIRPPPPPPPRVRWGRLAGLAAVGAVCVALVRWYIVSQATATWPLNPVDAPPVAQAPVAPAPIAAPPDDPYEVLERQLRAFLPTEYREVHSDGALEDALLVELTALRLRVTHIEAPVQMWGGRKNDQPERASVRIHLLSEQGELDWELGAVGLVVGKYVHHYGLKLSIFEVVFEGLGETPLRRPLDAERASQFYRERISLLEFLASNPSR